MRERGHSGALFVKVNHFVLVTITGNQLAMEARRFDGTVFDTLQIAKRNGRLLAVRTPEM